MAKDRAIEEEAPAEDEPAEFVAPGPSAHADPNGGATGEEAEAEPEPEPEVRAKAEAPKRDI